MVPSLPFTPPSKSSTPPSSSPLQVRTRATSASRSGLRCRRRLEHDCRLSSPSSSRSSSSTTTLHQIRSQSFHEVQTIVIDQPSALSSVPLPRPHPARAFSTKGPQSLSTPFTDMTALFTQLSSALKAEVKVVFEKDGVVDMVGTLNTGSSYSLPGHVIVTMPSLPSGFEGKLRELRELKLIFESKSEYWDDQGRYTPSRIYTTSLDLATPEKPLLIPSSDPLRSHSRTIGLAVGFDLRLPGWLPSSRVSTHVTTEHGMIVRSSAGWTEAATLAYDPPHIGHRMIQTRTIRRSVSLLAQLSSTTESHTSPYTPITIRRHRLPSAMSDRHSDHTERHYSLKPANDSTSPIECIVSVPDWVDCNGGEKDLKVSIRVRARREAVQAAVHASKPTSPVPVVAPTTPEASDDIETDNSAGVPQNLDHSEPLSVPMERDTSAEILTHILELGMEVDEVETYTSQPSPNFLSLFPIPADQPARSSTENDFISPRNERAAVPPSAAGNLDDKLFTSARRRKCLLADDGSQRNFVFDNDGLAMSERWRKVNIVLPMPQGGKKGSATCRPRSEYDSPMLRVKHALNIRVVCKNVGNPAEDIIVVLTTPIRFGTNPKTMPGAVASRPNLPAYIQLFHENGDIRECDPLPLYPSARPSCAPPPYVAPFAPVLPALSVPHQSLSPYIGSSRSQSPEFPSSSRSSVDESMDLDTPLSDDGHGETASSSASPSRGVLPIPIPSRPPTGVLARVPAKFRAHPAIAASA